MVTVGEAVLHVEGRLRLSAANGQPELDQRFALVEVYGGTFGGRIIELYHVYSRVE